MKFSPLLSSAVALSLALPLAGLAQTIPGGVRIGTAGTPDASAVLDLRPDAATVPKGFLPPRLSQAQRDAIASPAAGLVVYQTDNTPGLYVYTGAAWVLQGDNLGNHTATQPVQLNGQPLTNNGTGGLRIDNAGNVGIGTASPAALLQVGSGIITYSGGYGPNLALGTPITASSVYGAGSLNAPYKAIDNNTGTKWSAAANQSFPQWLQLDFGSRAPVVRRYELVLNSLSSNDAAGSWQLQGSPDGTTWATLHAGSATADGTYTFALTNTTAYRYYRLNILAARPTYNGSDITVAEWRVQEETRALAGPGLKVGPGTLELATGAAVSSFSTDGTLAGNSNSAVPTEQAVRTYVDATQVTAATTFVRNQTAVQAGASFNVDGSGTVGGTLVADANGANTGSVASALVFGRSSSGEGLGSNRSSGTNAFGLDFYTSSQNRLAITGGGNVGIGTTTPTQKLDVSGNVNVSGNSYVGGNVGIGTTTPAAKLDVSGNQNLTGTLQLNTPDQDKIYLTVGGAAGSKLGHANGWGLLSYAGPGTGSQGYHAWLLSGASAYQESMRLTATGLGIGTNAPSAALDVVGSVRLRSLGAVNSLLGTDADGLLSAVPRASLGDNLGNHTATQALNLAGNALVGTGADLGSAVGVGVRADGGLNLGQNTVGNNVLLGYQAGQSLQPSVANYQGIYNVLLGYQAGQALTTGYENVFSGYQAGYSDLDGHDNQFSGMQAGYNNTSGSNNLFSGRLSGYSNTTGGANLFTGTRAGYSNTTGNYNLFSGYASGYNNTTGSRNTAIGYNSGPASGSGDIMNATALGANVSLTQSNTVILGNGASVGIGTSAPIAKLHVSGGVTNDFTDAGYISYFSATSGFQNSQVSRAQTRTICAYFEGGNVFVDNAVHAGRLQVSSDARIKRVLGLSSPAADLALLKQLRITDYTYLDPVAHGSQVTKKVIAQEVEAVLPAAVSRSTQALPNVYARATALTYADGLLTLTCPTPHGLPAGGGRLRLFTATNEALSPLVTVVDARTVRFATAQAYPEGLFVYGKFVDDFRSVDYDALTTLTVSATQELARRVEALEAQNAALRQQQQADHAAQQAASAAQQADHASLESLQAELARLRAAAPPEAQARR